MDAKGVKFSRIDTNPDGNLAAFWISAEIRVYSFKHKWGRDEAQMTQMEEL